MISAGGELPTIRRVAAAQFDLTAGMISRASHTAASRFGGWAKLPTKRIVPGISASGSAGSGSTHPKGLTRTLAADSGAISAIAAASPSR